MRKQALNRVASSMSLRRDRSAAVSQTSRRNEKMSVASERFGRVLGGTHRCGWSATQPRSVTRFAPINLDCPTSARISLPIDDKFFTAKIWFGRRRIGAWDLELPSVIGCLGIYTRFPPTTAFSRVVPHKTEVEGAKMPRILQTFRPS